MQMQAAGPQMRRLALRQTTEMSGQMNSLQPCRYPSHELLTLTCKTPHDCTDDGSGKNNLSALQQCMSSTFA